MFLSIATYTKYSPERRIICRGFSISFNSIKPITNIRIYHKMVKDLWGGCGWNGDWVTFSSIVLCEANITDECLALKLLQPRANSSENILNCDLKILSTALRLRNFSPPHTASEFYWMKTSEIWINHWIRINGYIAFVIKSHLVVVVEEKVSSAWKFPVKR